MRDLKTIFREQIQLKWNHCLQRIKMINIYCASQIFSRNKPWIKPLKDKKGKTVLNAFKEIVNESNCEPNKLWFDQGREFYNKLRQEWLDTNDILMQSTRNEGKSVNAERFMKTLKPKIYKK